MSVLEDLADALAKEVIAAVDELGDDQLIDEIGKQLAASSSTMQEAYMTSIRMRLSDRRARAWLRTRLEQARAEKAAAETP